MYENMTADVILAQMLGDVSDSLDKREGSFIYNALAPVAVRLSELYTGLDNVIKESFADTAELDWLILRAAERGVFWHDAEKALIAVKIIRADDNELAEGERFFIGDVFFVWNGLKSDDGKEYLLECETVGAIGNISSGNLVYDGTNAKVLSAEISEIAVFGRDAESVDSLRSRYYESLESASFGGNASEYREKAMEISGVGGVQVRRAWNGGGTVKLVVIGSDYRVPSDTVINDVQTAFDPIENGIRTGGGIAPIDHTVTVVSATAQNVDILTALDYEQGSSWDTVKNAAFAAINEYFTDICRDWAENGSAVLRIGKIESALSSVPGIIEASDTKLNNNTQNIVFDGDSIPVLRTVNGYASQ